MAVKKQSAGILLYRIRNKQPEVFIVHPGGPFWKNKDEGAWSVPKGEFDVGQDPLTTAIREFREETGTNVEGDFLPLKPVRLKSGKLIHCWALQGDVDAESISSNTTQVEWPPRSGKKITIPEVDRALWCSFSEAAVKLNAGQVPLLTELQKLLQN